MKNQRGVTLIALVVTIIVLLIIAGISISTLTGDNGLIKNAIAGKEKTEIANETEILNISTIEAIKKDKYGDLRKIPLQNSLNANAGEGITVVTEDNEDNVFLIQFAISGRVYEVEQNGIPKIKSRIDGVGFYSWSSSFPFHILEIGRKKTFCRPSFNSHKAIVIITYANCVR